jgi:hypothetical protein
LFAAGRSGRTKCSVKFLTYIVCMHFCAHGGIDEKRDFLFARGSLRIHFNVHIGRQSSYGHGLIAL